MRPQYVTRDQVPDDLMANERRIAEQVTRDEGKPEQAIRKIVEGRLNAFLKDIVLVEQASVRDPKKSVKQLLAEHGASVTAFAGSRSARQVDAAGGRCRGGRQAPSPGDRESCARTPGQASPADRQANWRRVVLKLSGEAFAGDEQLGISPDVVIHLAREITGGRAARASRSPSSSAAATCSAVPRSPSAASTGPGPTTWACSAR